MTSHARAVKRVILWTTNLSREKNITLYDVPGYDSPTLLHKEQTKAKASTVDAILFAKKFSDSSLVDSELNILDLVKTSDKYVQLKDKIIVALTCCDMPPTRSEYISMMNKNKKVWQDTQVPIERVVPVCALAKSAKDPEIQNAMRKRLDELKLESDGIDQLKACTEEYILSVRYKYLSNRYRETDAKYHKMAKSIFELGIKSFPQTTDEIHMQKLFEKQREKDMMKWWAEEWKSIQEEFEVYFQKQIYNKTNPDDYSSNNSFFTMLREKYVELIDSLFLKVPACKEERQLDIYYSVGRGQGLLSAAQGHAKIRLELSESVYKEIQKISADLAHIMWKAILEMLNWITARFWGITEITDEIINDGSFTSTNLLTQQIEALILRFGRPANDLFLQFARSDNRKNTIKQYVQEIFSLDIFYMNPSDKCTETKGLLSKLEKYKHIYIL